MRRLAERIFFGIFALIVVVWGSYHFIQYKKSDIKTEAVLEYTASDTLTGRGIVFRTEQPLAKTQSGLMNYLHDDASHVALEESVAEFYSTNVDDSSIRRMRELEDEIKMLTQAENKNINNISSADAINREIRDQLGSISWMTSTGKYSSLEAKKKELTSLINRRHIATEKVEDYSQRIAVLEQEYELLKNRTGAHDAMVERAPVAGYFSKEVDGLETVLTPERMKTMSISDFEQYIQTEPETKTGNVGKIVTSHKWHLAVAMPAHQAEGVKKFTTVSLYFEQLLDPVPATVLEVRQENYNDTAIIILTSDIMTEDVINLRVVDVDISFGRHAGLRIDAEALRFQKDENGELVRDENGDLIRGVYILDNHQVKFRILNPVYENVDYVISRANSINPKDSSLLYVRLFDQVIIEGADLYEGKIIQ